MDLTQPGDPPTHHETVLAARQQLLSELGLEDSAFGAAFLELPVGKRVRVAGVRASLARWIGDLLEATGQDLQFGSYAEPGDEVTLYLPAEIPVRDQLQLPVLSPLPLKLVPLVSDLATRGPGAVAADLKARKPTGVAEAARRLREKPPAFEGWSELTTEDVLRGFSGHRPLLSDKADLYHRIRLACAHAADREFLDRLASSNPGFLDYLQCFPLARSIKRKVVAWLGPTNSGKTHRAIMALGAASSGMYLGPLRLLALEQRDRLTELGCPCSLITGEERDLVSETHSARTVEMTDFSTRLEVCVLDEMQLAFDRDRGWAWVAAYCGAAAETLIVTGPASAEPVIRRLGELCGDDVEVHLLERQGKLHYEGVIDWRRVPPRSAVIGFSRAMVLELKAMFESHGHRVSVIYGSLSPEVRRNEARRFREGESDIVCATDAIGLGLNLPLDRVIFYEVDKFDGEVNRALTSAELLQIAGRAGRGPGSTGLVAAFSIRDGRRIQQALAEPQRTPAPDRLPAAPTAMHVRTIAEQLGVTRLSTILDFFQTRLSFPGGTFFPDVQETVYAAADLVDAYAPDLPVAQRYMLACAPVDLEDYLGRNTFTDWVEALAAGRKVSFPRRLESTGGLEALEETLKLATLYRWLALKFPDAFTDLVYVEQMRSAATEQILAILRRNWGEGGLTRRECARCGRALLPSSPHRICRQCA